MPPSSACDRVLHILDTARATERRLDRALASARGIDLEDHRLLSALREADGRTRTRAELAERSGLAASAVARRLKPLEKLGYVSTEQAARDVRGAGVTLTDHGVLLVTDAEVVIANVVDAIRCFRVDDPAARHLVELLDR